MIYYLLIEAIPCEDNEESGEFGGAFVNCWVRADDQRSATEIAGQYIDSEGWEIVNIEEISVADRSLYDDDPELVSCYDSALEYGTSALFNTWPIEEDE